MGGMIRERPPVDVTPITPGRVYDLDEVPIGPGSGYDDEEDEELEPVDVDDDEDDELPIGDPAEERELEVEPPVLKSRAAVEDLARRGKPVDELRRRTDPGTTRSPSPWERPREGFSSAMGAKHGGSILGPGWEKKAGDP